MMFRILVIAIALMTAQLSCGSEGTQKGMLVGGPCTYDKIAGTCTATEAASDGKMHFTFTGTINGQNVELKDNNSSGGMAIGEKVDCMLEFITSGTCTPCIISIGECGKEAWDAFRSYKQ